MRARRWLAGGALLSLAAVAVALVSQHAFDLQPCPWCVLQRLVFVAVALGCAIGLVWRSRAGRRTSGALVLLLAAAGMAAALWQHFVAAASDSCKLTWAERILSALSLDRALPDVFQARASCAEAAVKLLGVPYEFYSLALFALLAFAALRVLRS